MSREVKQLIKQYEADRDAIVAFTDEIEKQVANGALTQELADRIIAEEFEGHDPKQLLRSANMHIMQAREIAAAEAPPKVVTNAVPVALILVIAAAVLVNFGAITGFFTFGSGETFYAIPLDQSLTGDTVIPLAISEPLSSLRVDGIISGTGTARLYLQEGQTKLLIASFNGANNGASPLTGRVTDGGETLSELLNETVPPLNETNSTNATNQTTAPIVNDTIDELIDEPITEEPIDDQTPTEPEPTQPDEVVLTPTPIVDEPTVVINEPQRTRTVTLENACVETCVLPALKGPHVFVLETTGNVQVQLHRLVWGTRGDVIPDVIDEVPAQPPIEDVLGETGPLPTTPINATNATNQTNTTNQTTPPANLTAPVFGDLGAVCTSNNDCASGVCRESRYQGALTGGVCAASVNQCTDGNTLYEPTDVNADSVCTQTSSGAAWIVRAGEGRFAIESKDGSLAGIIDKYGVMAVRGDAIFQTTTGQTGWLIKDTSGAVTLSIGEDGALRSTGTLTTRTTPQRTAAGDFVIRTAAGTDAAVITQSGDVSLAGDLLTGATLR